MKLIAKLSDKEVLNKETIVDESKATSRKAARAIVMDNKNKIAILSIPKYSYHKLPGGGIEDNEEIISALLREVKEETGCNIKIIEEIGLIKEYKGKYNQVQESFCYLSKVVGKKGKTNFTQDEKDAGFEIIWVNIKKAINIFKEDKPSDYTAKFINKRDYLILLEGLKLLDALRKNWKLKSDNIMKIRKILIEDKIKEKIYINMELLQKRLMKYYLIIHTL